MEKHLENFLSPRWNLLDAPQCHRVTDHARECLNSECEWFIPLEIKGNFEQLLPFYSGCENQLKDDKRPYNKS